MFSSRAFWVFSTVFSLSLFSFLYISHVDRERERIFDLIESVSVKVLAIQETLRIINETISFHPERLLNEPGQLLVASGQALLLYERAEDVLSRFSSSLEELAVPVARDSEQPLRWPDILRVLSVANTELPNLRGELSVLTSGLEWDMSLVNKWDQRSDISYGLNFIHTKVDARNHVRMTYSTCPRPELFSVHQESPLGPVRIEATDPSSVSYFSGSLKPRPSWKSVPDSGKLSMERLQSDTIAFKSGEEKELFISVQPDTLYYQQQRA